MIINEVMAVNASTHTDQDFGTFCDWIELYNPGDGAVDLSGFFLSDDPANPTMWGFQDGTTLSPGEYLLIYADDRNMGLHTNFKLSGQGERLMLTDAGGKVIDSLGFMALPVDISFGLIGDQPGHTGFFDNPTPGMPNGDEAYAGIASPPFFSLDNGFYPGPRMLGLLPVNENARYHYTLDGSEPDASSPLYTGPILLDHTTVVRVKSFVTGFLPGPVVTRTYFINEVQNLPVISLSTDPDHFFSDETGIYVIGTAGRPGYCTEVPHNVNQDWERPVNIELFEKDGTIGLNQQAGAKIFGGCSRVRYPIKSLALFARREYGDDDFNYRIFPDKENEEYKSFILRAAADDQPFTLFRDGLTAMLVKDVIDVDVQAYRPAVLYINGQYWGIHNLREKINEHYPSDNYGVNTDSVELLTMNPESDWNVLAGSADHYNRMIDYLEANDITQDVHYDHVRKQMDIDEYINYQIVEIFFGGRDWPGNNIKFWRSREAPFEKWRWVLYDLDHMLNDPYGDIMEEATEEDCGCNWPNPPWSTYLFRRLLENDNFRHEFSQRFALYADTHFSRERILNFIDEMQAVIAPEIPRHVERWGGQVTDLPDNTWVEPIFNSVAKWEENVQVMRDFTLIRHELALKHLNDYFRNSGFAGLKLDIEPPGSGRVGIAGLEIPQTGGAAELLAGEPINLEAEPGPGYVFSHWIKHQPGIKDTSLVEQGALWLYLDTGIYPGSGWMSPGYDDGHWSTGHAQLGYGDGDEATIISYGDDPGSKYISTWFRKSFNIPDTDLFSRYTLNLIRDDGARIYLNGREVVRENMQRWVIGPTAMALNAIGGTEENQWISFGLNPDLFRTGENVLAVEMHQASAGSSDISFDLELIARQLQPGTEEELQEASLGFILNRDTEITAVMMPDTNVVDSVFINEIMASSDQGLTDEYGEFEDWVELYNGGSEAVDVGGLFLADNFPATSPWRIPTGMPGLTTMGPGEFLVVFSDNEPEQGPLHATFKLSKEGEEVVLMQRIGSDTLVIDRLTFGLQGRNISFGRIPDGGIMLELLSRATPGAPNFLETQVPEIALDTKDVLLYPVPSHGPLYVKFNEGWLTGDVPVEIAVYSITGRMLSRTMHQSSPIIGLSLDPLPEGIYILDIRAGDLRFVKRIIRQ